MHQLARVAAGLSVAIALTWSQRAEACGCFAPPNAAEPIVQAGERILFSVKDGKVTAHIQIQYAGEAKDFGWLLPLPSIPTLKIGSDELFTQLGATTQPSYSVTQVPGTPCRGGSAGVPLFGCASPQRIDRTGGFGTQDAGTSSPLVVADSVGPYEYAVLRADDQTAMLEWLATNGYFVPAGTTGAVGPYVRPGGYFLALRLKAGASSGDVTPVVLEYPSELPMIPIILTSVGATPNMGVQVYLLGTGRGIPRNYHHVVLNDALLDWMNGAGNYASVVTAAVAAAPQKHAFVTEYAGPSAVMHDVLVPPGRFGTEAELAAQTTPERFVSTLLRNGFDPIVNDGRAVLPSPVIQLLLKDIPLPAALKAKGITENTFLTRLDYYLGPYRVQYPADFDGYVLDFDAPSLAQQLFAQYVTPLREANALFDEFPTLTRLITTLSPEDMTADPVFSFNPELPNVSRQHEAKFINDCGVTRLVTEQGWVVNDVRIGASAPAFTNTPVALRVEVLGEEGQATVATDNQPAIHERFPLESDPAAAEPAPMNGCSTIDPMSLGLLVLMFRRRRS